MIAIPVKSDSKTAEVSTSFGTAKFFAFIENDDITIEQNPAEDKGNKKAIMQKMVQKGVKNIIFKHIGDIPFLKLNEKGIKFYFATKEKNTLDEILQKFKSNSLKQVNADDLQWLIDQKAIRVVKP